MRMMSIMLDPPKGQNGFVNYFFILFYEPAGKPVQGFTTCWPLLLLLHNLKPDQTEICTMSSFTMCDIFLDVFSFTLAGCMLSWKNYFLDELFKKQESMIYRVRSSGTSLINEQFICVNNGAYLEKNTLA